MSQPTYRIAQRLHERRAAMGIATYGRHLDADSQGCMLVHALEEAADLTEYLLAEVQRRKIVLETLNELSKEMHAELAIGWAYNLEKLYDLLGGKSAIEQYDEILGGGTIAENATVDARDEALDTVEMALRNIVAGSQKSAYCNYNAQAALDALSRHRDKATATDPRDEALLVAESALALVCYNEDRTTGFDHLIHRMDMEACKTALDAIRAAGGAR